MKRSEVIFGVIRVPLDALASVVSLLLSYYLRSERIDLIPNVQLLEEAQTLPEISLYITSFVIPSTCAIVILAALFRLYSLKTTLSAWQEFWRVIIIILLWLIGIVGWYFLIKQELFYSRMLLAHSALFLILYIAMFRALVQLVQRYFLRSGIGVHRVITFGKHRAPRSAQETLEQDSRYEYVGHAKDLLGLKKIIKIKRPDLIIQTDPAPKGVETTALIDYCRSNHLGYAFLPPVFADVPHQLSVQHLGLIPMLQFNPTPLDGWGRVWKRMFDLIASALLIILLSPILILVAILILILSGWPVFYISKRVGERAEESVPVLKFRSMIREADRQKRKLSDRNERRDGPLFKMRDDPRITTIGRILRRFDLDELPQLFNVLIGQMSLVGPRPHLPEEVKRYKPYERRVFAVKPGITGMAQISGRSNLSFKEEVHLDLQYIEEWSLMFDLWILWRTVWVVISRERNVERLPVGRQVER